MKRYLILGILIGLSFSTICVYAKEKYLSSDIKYKDTTVESALNDLYNKYNQYNECVYGTYEATNQCATDDGCLVENKLEPKIFILYNSGHIIYYNYNLNKNYVSSNGSDFKYALNGYYKITDGGLYTQNMPAYMSSGAINYIACK